MAQLNLIVDNQPCSDLVVNVNQAPMNSLLSDEVVMQWLMELEAEDCTADMDDSSHVKAAPTH